MSKKTLNSVEEVRAERKAGFKFVFNMEAAEIAVSKTPLKKGGEVSSELSKGILEIFTNMKKELSCAQIVAVLKSGGLEVTSKQVCDKCWYLAKKGKIVTVGKGVYGPVAE